MHLDLQLGAKKKHFKPRPQHQILKPLGCPFYMEVSPPSSPTPTLAGAKHALPKRKISCNNFLSWKRRKFSLFWV